MVSVPGLSSASVLCRKFLHSTAMAYNSVIYGKQLFTSDIRHVGSRRPRIIGMAVTSTAACMDSLRRMPSVCIFFCTHCCDS